MKPIVIYEPFSVVVVPFPFTDQDHAKRRPALVLSSLEHQEQTHHITLLMITKAKRGAWISDCPINNLLATGLTTPSIIRQKLFTIDIRLIIKSIGELSLPDKKEVVTRLKRHIF
jgi:mRNA interferase MazF